MDFPGQLFPADSACPVSDFHAPCRRDIGNDQSHGFAVGHQKRGCYLPGALIVVFRSVFGTPL